MNRDKLEQAARLIIEGLGDDPDRHGLAETPRRFADAWLELAGGIDEPPAPVTTFLSDADQMVIVRGIKVWSVCEHHLLPFWVDLTIAYLPEGKILGLSKFARVAQRESRMLMVQETLVNEIADRISEAAGTKDVAVIGTGQHLCMNLRGVKQHAAIATTSVLYGAFRNDPATRAEFFALATQSAANAPM